MILIISCDDIGKDYFWNTDNKELFIRKFGTLGYDYGWSLSFSPYDNGIILTGSQQAKINQEKNLWAIKTNSYGIVEWEKSIGGEGNEEGYDVISTSDGGFLFVGYTWSYGNEQQVYVVKTDYYGNILWEKNYGGAMWDVGNSVIELIDGNYAIIGYSNSPGISSGNTDMLLIKIDINGNLIYLKSYGNELYPNHEWGTDIIELNDNGFILIGSRDRYENGAKNVIAIRTNASGEIIWEKEFITDGNKNETASSISADKRGGFYICGSTNIESKPDLYKPKIIKIDLAGNIDWQRLYDSDSKEYHRFSAISSENGDLIITGTSINNSSSKLKSDAFITRIDYQGSILWSRPYGTLDNDDWGWNSIEMANGNIAMIGSTKSYNASLFDILLISLNPNGTGK